MTYFVRAMPMGTLVWISHEDKIAGTMLEYYPFWQHFRRSGIVLGGKNSLSSPLA